MKYTEKERSILINLYEIRKLLDDKEADFYEEKIEILRNGYEIFYSSDVHESMPEEESQEVLKILHMYMDFEDAYSRAGEMPDHTFAKFSGFCGNYEGRQLAFARFVIEKQGKFPQLAKYIENLNSHVPLLSFYRLMLDIWIKYPAQYRTHQFTNEDVVCVIEQVERSGRDEYEHN